MAGRGSIWTGGRAIRYHVTLAVLLPSFAYLAWWQLHRALAGNDLSWAYTVEWPIFMVYAVYLWWKLLHEDRAPLESKADRRPAKRSARAAKQAAEEAQLAAYNAYLAELHASDQPRR